ncbi:MAG TPA: extracellular solute-binding protein [Gemmatimonadales bacterium]
MRRRELLRLAASLAATGPLAHLAACGGPDRGGDRELRVLARQGFLEPALLAAFEREHGIAVTVERYELGAPGSAAVPEVPGIDLIVLPAALAATLGAADRLTSLDAAQVPGLADVLPVLRGAAGEHPVVAPLAWEATGTAWIAGELPDVPGASPGSWCVFFEPALAGRMTMLDDPREVFGAMLRLRGHRGCADDASLLQQARDDALASRAFLRGYRAPGAAPVLGGGVVVAQARSGEALRAAAADARIRFGIPKEGGPLFAEVAALAAGAPHPRAAHAFLDYILRPEPNAAFAAAAGRHPVHAAPAAIQLDRLEPAACSGDAATLYDRLWTEIQSA